MSINIRPSMRPIQRQTAVNIIRVTPKSSPPHPDDKLIVGWVIGTNDKIR